MAIERDEAMPVTAARTWLGEVGDRIKAAYDLRHPNLAALATSLLFAFVLPGTYLAVSPGWDSALGLAAALMAWFCGFYAFPLTIKKQR